MWTMYVPWHPYQLGVDTDGPYSGVRIADIDQVFGLPAE
jgi:hypothetical protein